MDKLLVFYKKSPILKLNADLLTQQNAWENLEKIKALHLRRLELGDKMAETDDVETLRALDAEYVELEFDLQAAWGFPRDARMHRFWERPKCECPIDDNRMRYGTDYCIVAANCPLHGEKIKKHNNCNWLRNLVKKVLKFFKKSTV